MSGSKSLRRLSAFRQPALCPGLAALGLALVSGLGCQTVGRTVAMPEGQPPLAELVAPPAYLTPRSQRYRIAVRPFVDQTGQAADVAEVGAEVLMTALHARDRFSLFDAGEFDVRALAEIRTSPAAVSAPGTDVEPAPHSLLRPGATDVYQQFQGMVDGVLEGYVTAIRRDKKGNGHFEVDYRVVDPYSRMVVTSGNARIGLAGGTVVRRDFQQLALAVSRSFIDPVVMAQYELKVREISLEGNEVTLTLDGGSEKKVERGAVGFVVESDRVARVDRYLAKFVVVTVFPEAAVGVVVEHCNAVGRCPAGSGVVPVEQALNVHPGAEVRFK